MNLIELDRALRQLRMSGMAATLETRLLQAQTDAMAHIDLVSMLVSDELECRSKRLLERRHKQAEFRDPDKRLDNFDFQFNAKMNRNLIFDLATAGWIQRREDSHRQAGRRRRSADRRARRLSATTRSSRSSIRAASSFAKCSTCSAPRAAACRSSSTSTSRTAGPRPSRWSTRPRPEGPPHGRLEPAGHLAAARRSRSRSAGRSRRWWSPRAATSRSSASTLSRRSSAWSSGAIAKASLRGSRR